VLFCGGYTSDMNGTKALALDRHCRARGRAYTRFDYRGHGASDGRFAAGTIGSWLADALAVARRRTIGSSKAAGDQMRVWRMRGEDRVSGASVPLQRSRRLSPRRMLG
jgi:pimeloyl-ACP methyl ester carboxylesterase